MKTNRRVFVLSAAFVGQALAPVRGNAAAPVLDPGDPQASVLGYTPDAQKVAPAFEQKHVAGAHCGNCALFQGKATETPGPCPLFGGKMVQGKGWCGSWVAKG